MRGTFFFPNMTKNRIVSVLCLAVFSFCLVYAQTSGRWINYFEDEDGIYSYRSDFKTDKDNNHYVWIKWTITSPKERMKIANDINSSTPVHNVLFQIEFDSGYELSKLLQFAALSNSGKVLLEAKSEILGKWNVADEDDKFLQALSTQLRGQSGRAYKEQNRRSDRVYPETNNESGKVYEKLLEKIKDKQDNQAESDNDASEDKQETPHKLLVSNIEYGSISESQVTNTNGLLNMIDGKPSTAWVVNLDQASYDCDALYGPIFSLNCKKLTHIVIHNGYAKSYEAYRNNARALRLIFSNYDYLTEDEQLSYLFEGSIKDTPEEQTLVVDPKKNGNNNIKKIQIIFPVDGLRYGTKWKDLCVSEIEFWGY